MTFDLRTPNSNLTCILVSSTYISKISKIHPRFLKLLCGNQFEYIMSCDLWPLTCGLRIQTWPVFWCHLPTYRKYLKSVQDFWSYCAETNLNIWAVTFDLWAADSEFELNLYFGVIYLHIKNFQNPSNILEVIVQKPIWIYNELWPLTFDLRTPNSNLTCILVSSTYISKISKIRPRVFKLLCGNQFEYIMSCDLLTFDLQTPNSNLTCILVSSTYISKNIQNPSKIFEVIVRKPIWIYNELWPLTFDLRTPNSNLTCILVSSTYISKISKIRPRVFKLLCGNQFEYIMSCDLWPLTCGLRIRTWPVFWCHLSTYRKYPKSVQDFWSYCAETNLNI